MIQDVTLLIIGTLKQELPEYLYSRINDFEALVNDNKYKIAFSILDELKRTDGWSPSQKLLSYFERFWWEMAN